MQLYLNIESSAELSPSIRNFSVLENGKCTIGRNKDASWCLPDPTRFLSAIHCEIISQSGRFYIVDRSANGLLVDSQKPFKDVPFPLKRRSMIEMGPFQICAILLENSEQISENNDQTVIKPRRKSGLRNSQNINSPSVANLSLQQPNLYVSKITKSSDAGAKPHIPSKGFPAPVLGGGKITGSLIEEFSKGASIMVDSLGGRTDNEFARELGRTMQTVTQGLLALSKSVHLLRELVGSDNLSEHGNMLNTSQTNAQNVLVSLFAVDRPGYQRSDQVLGDIIADLAGHDQAVFFALQAALFRLLNELSPTTIEAKNSARLFSSKKSALWDDYVALWANLSAHSENGLLDVYIRYFKEAYDAKLNGK
jgi:type VI secretion system protein ImpI